MTDKPSRPATYADVEALPANVIGEIVGGVLHVQPRPAGPHVVAASRLGQKIGAPFDAGDGGPGGWWILDEPELHLHEDVVVPDLAGWHRERMPQPPKDARFTVVPDWICEVLSPSTKAWDKGKKLKVYGREGVKHAWYIDPMARSLDVLRSEGANWILVDMFEDGEKIRAEPFEAIELDLGALWLPA